MTELAEQRKQFEAELAEMKASLANLEVGQAKHFEELPNGTFREITSDLIAERRRAVAGLEALLASIKKLAP